MKILITGSCGFLGTNLALDFLKRGFQVIGIDNLSREGSAANRTFLEPYQNFSFFHRDIRNSADIDDIILHTLPDHLFHLAGQVAMTTSIKRPRFDFEVNTIGTINILEALRKYSPETNMVYSSTNKVYGDLEYLNYIEGDKRYECAEYPRGFDEQLFLNFESPYGCSKGAAEQYVQDYSRIYGLSTVVLRHSSMFGGRQFATEDQGWIGWFCDKAVKQKMGLEKNFNISGSGKQVRDLLHSNDMCELYYQLIQNTDVVSGHVFNVGGGMANSLSLLQLFDMLEDKLDVNLRYEKKQPRKSDQKIFVADTRKLYEMIGWQPLTTADRGIDQMLQWTQELAAADINRKNYE